MSGGARALTQDERMALEWWARFLADARPRVVPLGEAKPLVCIFVDGAVEDEGTSIGGIVVDQATGLAEMWGTVVGRQLTERLRGGRVHGQVIGQAEIAPVAVAVKLWSEAVRGRNVIIFIDNDSAREALIRGYSPALASSELIAITWLAIAESQCVAWFARVPGPSNIGDGPSRLSFPQAGGIGVRRVHLPGQWPSWLAWAPGTEQ